MKPAPNVNVTLPPADWYLEKRFPCPLCGSSLQIRVARTQKPYCHCDPCGIQLFFRGRNGIERLQKLVSSGALAEGSHRATVLYNRLEQLKKQRSELENRQGIVFRDRDRDSVIRALENEIESVRAELAEASKNNRRKSK